MKRKYSRWRAGNGSKETFIKERKRLRELLEKKRKEKREEEEKELRNLKNEKEVWRYINRRRKKKEWKKNSIQGNEWREYLMGLLEGTENVSANVGEENISKTTEVIQEEGAQEEEKELEEEEIANAVKLKVGKAAGIDEIPAEVRRCSCEEKDDRSNKANLEGRKNTDRMEIEHNSIVI